MQGIFIAIGVLCIMSCTDDGMKKSKLSGYSYKVYRDDPGANAKVGEHVYFQMDIVDDQGKTLQSYKNQKRMPAVKIAPAEDQVRIKNPIVDVLSNLSLGDSVGIFIPKDSMPSLPPEYDYVNMLEYRLTVKEILTNEQFQNRMLENRRKEAEEAENQKTRLPEIEELARKTLSEYKKGTLMTQPGAEGLEYVIHERGDGDRTANDLMVSVHYYGLMVDTEKMFDTSFAKGIPYTFRLGRSEVIRGWDVGILDLPVGTKASLFIPSELAYGELGYGQEIPPNSDLHFYVEVAELFY